MWTFLLLGVWWLVPLCGASNGSLAPYFDWFMIFRDWEEHFSSVGQSILLRPNFSPILLHGGSVRKGKSRF